MQRSDEFSIRQFSDVIARHPGARWFVVFVLFAVSARVCDSWTSAAKAAGAATKTLYVAVDGNDNWSGRLPAANDAKTDGPFATLTAARNAIRRLKAGADFAGPVTVMVRGGTYFLDKPLVFTPEDGGTRDAPVTYKAYRDEKPVVSGGRIINAAWKPYRGKILVCTVPEVKAGKWYFRQLAVNGKRQQRSRTPDEGEYLIEKATSPTSFIYRDRHVKPWKHLEDVEVVVFHSWNETRFRVKSLDADKRLIRFLDPKARHVLGWGGAGGPNRYYIENTLEGITRPGEWYLERSTGRLYWWPACDPNEAAAVAPVLRELVRLQGDLEKKRYVENLNFDGFTFCDSDWSLPANGYPDCGDVGDIVPPSMVTLQAARFCRFRNNCFKNGGTYALEVTGDGNLIEGNTIHDMGGGGIITRSYGKQPNVIAYNHIHHCGLVYPSSVGINIDDGGGRIAHNLIHHITHSGVYGRHWATATQRPERRNQEQGLVIEQNEIHHVMLNINDGAGIFIRDSNIVINNNLIHDVYAALERCPGWGIYLGCETRNTKVTNNVVYNTLESLHVWYKDRNVVIENNVFVGPRRCQVNYGNARHLKHENIRFVRNIVYCTSPKGHLFSISGERSLPTESDHNIVFSAVGCVLNDPIIRGLPGVQSFTQWRGRGFDEHSITADPKFKNPEKHDYSLKPESPAFKVGFRPIALSRVGLRGSKWERQ